MTEKAKNDLASELMRRYNIKSDDDQVEFKPPKPPSEEAASDPFYSSPSPAAAQETSFAINPLLKIQEEEDRKKQEKPPENVLQRNEGLAEVGGVLGGAAQYKGVGQNVLKPAVDLFAHRDANMPSGQKSSVLPTVPMSDVEHTMQSGQGQRPGETGRMRENTHNQETQRQALATKEGLEAPGAARAVVQAGPMYTTESGIPIPKRAGRRRRCRPTNLGRDANRDDLTHEVHLQVVLVHVAHHFIGGHAAINLFGSYFWRCGHVSTRRL
jgi:hypothetical protein